MWFSGGVRFLCVTLFWVLWVAYLVASGCFLCFAVWWFVFWGGVLRFSVGWVVGFVVFVWIFGGVMVVYL